MEISYSIRKTTPKVLGNITDEYEYFAAVKSTVIGTWLIFHHIYNT